MKADKQENRIVRDKKQIVDKVKSFASDPFSDAFGFKTADLVSYLEFEDAKEFLQDGVTEEQWGKPLPSDRDSVIEQMKDYMAFAWDKANNGRGLSAGRSMAHYTAWVWMAGDESVFGDLEDYQFYGKDNLVKLCEYYGWDHKQWDDGVRTN